MKVTALPQDDYRLDTSNPEEQWRKSVNENFKGLMRKNGNSNVITPLTYNFVDAHFSSAAFNYGNGYVVPPAPNQGYTFFNLPKPENFKVRNVQNITLTINISLQLADVIGSSTTAFTAPVYFYLGRQVNDGEALTNSGSFIFPWLLIPLGNLVYDPTVFANPFSIETQNINLNLSDTIVERVDLTGSFNFNIDNNKIDQNQYNQLLTTNNKMISNIYIDSSGLTLGQKTFFDTIFPQQKYPGSAVSLNYTLTFYYNGIASTFQPLTS